MSAQNGPGGVGNYNGSGGQPENIIWLAADSLDLNNNDPVTSWQDISGNNNHATHSNGGQYPLFYQNELNGYPGVYFDGTDDYLPLPGNEIAGSDYTLLFVGKRRTNSGMKVAIAGENDGTNNNLHIYFNNEAQFRSHHYGNDLQTDMVTVGEAYDAGTVNDEYGIFSTLLASSDASDQRRNYQNNHFLGSRSDNRQLNSWNGAALARYDFDDGASYDYEDFNFTEVIIYSNALNDAQLNIVHNYLSEKYNITIDNDLFSDTAEYNHFIAGIGQESNGSQDLSASDGMYISQNGGLDDGEYLFASNDSAVNNVSTLKKGTRVTNTGAEAAWNREWLLEQTGSFNAKIAFDFSEGIENGKYPQELSNYVLLYRADTSSDYSVVTVSEQGIQNSDQVYFNVSAANVTNGYYTLASMDTTESPLQGDEAQTWYTLISGDWSDPNTWTLDPSGALPDNPTNDIPGETDKVEILSGNQVTVQPASDSINLLEARIDGRLDLTTTEGHDFGVIEGSGKVLMAADNFPDGDVTGFVSDEGVVEFYGNSFTLDTTRTFFDVIVNMDAASDTLTLLDDYTINGDFTVEQGIFRINDNTSTTILNLEVLNDVIINNQAKIITGEGNTVNGNYSIGGTMPDDDGKEFHDIFHQFIIKGDFTNNGVVRFTNLNAPDYDDFASNGAVTVRLKGASDAQITLNDTTDFYFLVIDKGTDKTYTAEIYSDNTRYFQLFGPNNCGRLTTGSYTASNPLVQKALWVKTGTLKLTGNIHIPSLSEGQVSGGNGDYAVGENARFVMAGSNVTVYSTANNVDQILHFTSSDTYQADGVEGASSNQAMTLYGEFKITDGFFGTRNSAGFIFWPASNAQVKIEGGECHVAQMRSAGGGSGVASYIQSGGTVYAFGNEGPNGGEYTGAYSLFGLEEPAGVFQMSGGEIILQDYDGDADPEFYIPSLETNYNVTGGTVRFDLDGGSTAQLSSTANLWNLELRNTSGTGDVTIELANELKVSNDLTINANTFLDHEGYDVSIGHDFYISENASQQPGSANNYGYLYDPALPNTTTFNGDDHATFYIGHPDSEVEEWELYMNRLVLNKPNGKHLIIDSDTEKEAANVSAAWRARILRLDSIYVQSGVLNQSDFSVRLTGNVVNYDQIGVYTGSTHDDALIMFAWSRYEVETSDNAVFGNIKLNVGNDQLVSFSSDVYIKRIWYKHGRLYPGIHNLKVDEIDYDLGGGSNRARFDWDQDGSIQGDEQGVLGPNDMFAFDGNPSDGGLSLKITGNGTYTFPIGIDTTGTELLHNGAKYTPAEVTISNFNDDGYITINPVDEELQTTDLTGGDILSYYWRVDYSDFTTEPTVEYSFNYYEADLDGSVNEGSFVPGKVQDINPYNRSYENDNTQVSGVPDTDDTLNVIVFNDHNNGGNGFTLEKANYTAGESNRFVGSPDVFYSVRNSGWDGYDWDNNTSWYDSPTGSTHPPDYPEAGDVAVIRGNDGQDNIDVSGTQEAAEVVFQREGTYSDIEDLPRLRFNSTDVLTVSKVSGVGELYLQRDQSNAATLNGDIGDFAANDTSLIDFYMLENGTYDVAESDFFAVMPTLRIYGQNSNNNREARFNYDFECKNLIVDGEARLLINGNYTVENRTRLGYTGHGSIEFPNGTSSYTFSTDDFVTGRAKNQADNDYQITVASGGGNGVEHIFEVRNNIELDFTDDEGTLNWDFYTNAADNNVILKLTGIGFHSFVNGYDPANSTIDFYKIEMDKGTDQSSTFTFDDDFTLNGPTQGVDVEKALIMKNGTLIFDDPDINVDLTTGDDNFYIPSASALEIRQGQVNASGNSGILLDGKLNVNGGTVDMAGGDNYIEYSSSGNATIEISSGTLSVGSQIRRKTTTQEGILNYYQSGGTVIAGENSAPEDDRGVFEILNAGSDFELTGGELYIANAQNNPSVAALYLEPASSNLTTGGKIILGHSSTGTDQTIGVNSSIDIPKLFVSDASNNSPEAKIWIRDLTITDTLNIGTGTSFNTSGLDLYMSGDFIAQGTYSANGNITYFNGSANQEITGKTQFYNLYKTGSDTLFLNDTITANNNFRLEDGVLSDQGNNLVVKGDIFNQGMHVWGGSGDGILVNGTENQEMKGNGTYGKLSINNIEGLTIPEVGNNVYIDDALQMEKGVFDIGKNLLELDSNAVIIEKSAFSDNNMIQTNISFTDAGIRKYFPVIEQDTSFTYPLGSGGKYTPVVFDIDSSLQYGYIRVKAANERHPSIQEDSESPCELTDSLNVLQYHWLIDAQDISGFDASVSMYAEEEDVWVNNTCGYTEADYITARLLENSVLWNKYDPFSFDESNNRLDFTFSDANADGLKGDYTAGIDSTGFEGAIPDSVPVYHSAQNGNWKLNTTWEEDIAGGPRGAIVIIDDTVTVTKNFLVSYKTVLEPTGVLRIESTFGHRLGLVEGEGTLSTWRGDLPAADYEDFFSPAGGTLEYAGTNDLNILAGISSLNNLRFTNTGIRRFPNADIVLYGNLEILGDDNNLEVINDYDRTLNIEGNLTFTEGSFDAGTGSSAEVVFDGSSLQTITGSFEGSNAFNYLTLQNSSGLELHDSVSVDQTLTLNSGMVYLPDTGLVTLNSTATGALSGAADTRYIQGPLRKKINNGDTYTFEVGDTSRYGRLELSNTSPTTAEFWEVQYYNNETHPTYDTSSYESSLERISNNEYWRVKGPGATSDAFVKIRWDDQSVLPAQTSNRSANLRIAEWNTGASEWQSVGSDVTDNGVTSGTVRTNSSVALEEHIFTLASTEPNPQATAAFSTEDTAVCVNETIQLTATLSGQGDIVFTINKDGIPYDTITASSEGDTTFIINSSAVLGDAGVYSIDSVGDDNGTGYVYGESVTVTVNSLPDVFNVIDGGTVCDDDSVEIRLDGSVAGINYELYRNSTYTGIVVGGTGDTISFGYFDDPSDNGNYEVLAINSSTGCEQYMNGVVNVTINTVPNPEPYINETNPICYNEENITLYANDVTGVGNDYSWTPAGDLDNAGAENPDYLTSNPPVRSDTTMFNVTVTDTGTGCQATDSVQVILLRRPETGNQYYVPDDFDQ